MKISHSFSYHKFDRDGCANTYMEGEKRNRYEAKFTEVNVAVPH